MRLLIYTTIGYGAMVPARHTAHSHKHKPGGSIGHLGHISHSASPSVGPHSGMMAGKHPHVPAGALPGPAGSIPQSLTDALVGPNDIPSILRSGGLSALPGSTMYNVMSGPAGESILSSMPRPHSSLSHAAQAQDIAALNASLNAEEALALGMSPDAAKAYSTAMSEGISEIEAKHFAQALSGDVVGGGVSGFNLGGANNPRAATSNIFHNPLEAALHEAGPFGSRSALSANMVQIDDATVRQRVSESLETVHDDTLKANLAKKQRLEAQLEQRRQKAIVQMNEIIKQNASAAAQRDGRVSQMKAEAIAARAPGGNLSMIVPGTNKTYMQMVEEEMAKAEHAASHARNPDLYELENAAEKTGFPRPTIGQEIIDQAIKNMLKKNMEEAQAAKALEMRRFAETKAANEAAAIKLMREKAANEAAIREAHARFAAESEAVQAAEANEAYQRAIKQERTAKLQINESIAANIPSAGELKVQKKARSALGLTTASIGESAVVNAADRIAAENALITASARSKINADEAAVACIGEKAASAKSLQNLALSMQANASARMDLANQKMGEAMVAKLNGSEIDKAVRQHTNLIAAAGEAAVAQAAIAKGRQLTVAAANEEAIAESTRLRGADLAAAAVRERSIADAARVRGASIAAEAAKINAMSEMAAAKTRALAQEAAKENAIAAEVAEVAGAKVKGKLEDELESAADADAEAAKEAEAAGEAGFNDADPYKILGTIPDDADTVAITNSSIDFPFKTFTQAKAHNQAEAGALAAQNKIRDDIRGKVTADKFDSPLNTIKGEGGYLNIPENAEKINVESGRAYYSEAAEASMKKEGLDVSHLEHKINTGERSDMGIGLGYYVADVSGMEVDVPSPLNPDPPRVMTGKGLTLDVTQAQGVDIEKGELKLEKWQEYSRRVRPQVNMNIISNGRESIIEAVVDDECVKQALKDADAMYNTRSELIVNPSGESFIRVTPPYGVSEQISYDEAVFNLDRIKQSCRISHGQIGISSLQQKESQQIQAFEIKEKVRGLNIAETEENAETSLTEEEELRKNALENASGSAETHHFVQKVNAFDQQVHGEKKEILEEGTKALAIESGMSKEEFESKNTFGHSLREEMENITAEKEEMSGEAINMMESKNTVCEEEMMQASTVKQSLLEYSSQIAKEIGMTESEVTSILSKISIKTFASFFQYASHSTETISIRHFEKSKSELRLLFGIHTESFISYVFNYMSQIYGIGDPNERVIIKKETHYVPKMVRKTTQDFTNGQRTTLVKSKMLPVTRITRIPVRTVIRNSSGQEVSPIQKDSNTPVGDKISETINSEEGETKTHIEGPNGIGSEHNKIKLEDNSAIFGTVNDIKTMVDAVSIGHITNPSIAIASQGGISSMSAGMSAGMSSSSSSSMSAGMSAGMSSSMSAGMSAGVSKLRNRNLTTNNGSSITTKDGILTIKDAGGKVGTLIKKGDHYINTIDGGIINNFRGDFGTGGNTTVVTSNNGSIQSINNEMVNENGKIKLITGRVPKDGQSVIDENGNIKPITPNQETNKKIIDNIGNVKSINGARPDNKTSVSPFSSRITEVVIGQASAGNCDCKVKENNLKKNNIKKTGKTITLDGGIIKNKGVISKQNSIVTSGNKVIKGSISTNSSQKSSKGKSITKSGGVIKSGGSMNSGNSMNESAPKQPLRSQANS
ncbi:hypothetical protein COBT_000794, partial [Conglomerata obtusa]